jgi:hypothetical protein
MMKWHNPLKSYYDIVRMVYYVYDTVGNTEVYVGTITAESLHDSERVSDRPKNLIIKNRVDNGD